MNVNVVRAALLLGITFAPLIVVFTLLGGSIGLAIALMLTPVCCVILLAKSDRLALRLHAARQVSRRSFPDLVETVERLAARAGLPPPRVYVIDADLPNAFATGLRPDRAAIAVTLGLVHKLTADEVEGVIAHEIAHIRTGETVLMNLVAVLAGSVSVLAARGYVWGGREAEDAPEGRFGWWVLKICMAISAWTVRVTVLPRREFVADRIAAELTGKPAALASALARLVHHAGQVPLESANQHPNTGHLFTTFPVTARPLLRWFATHPSPELRIGALRGMAHSGRYAEPGRVVLLPGRVRDRATGKRT